MYVFISCGTEVNTPCSESHEQQYGIPALEELCPDADALGEEPFPGGEQEALRRLEENMKRTVFHLLLLLCMTSHHFKPFSDIYSVRTIGFGQLPLGVMTGSNMQEAGHDEFCGHYPAVISYGPTLIFPDNFLGGWN